MPTCWSLDISIKLGELLTFCRKEFAVDRLLVIARMDTKGRYLSSNITHSIKEIFGHNIIDNFLASGWPGTELIGHVSRVFVIEFSELVQQSITEKDDQLFSWTHHNRPPLPEDLCLFRQGGAFPNLISVTHEDEAWLISDKKIQFQGAHKTKVKLSDLLVFDGKYFCKT